MEKIGLRACDGIILIDQPGKQLIGIDVMKITDTDIGVLIEALLQIQDQINGAKPKVAPAVAQKPAVEKVGQILPQGKPKIDPPGGTPCKAIFAGKGYVCAVWHETKQIVISAIIDIEKKDLIRKAERISQDFYWPMPVSLYDYDTLSLLINDGWRILENKDMIAGRQERI